jgi:hypothetical protein
VPLDLPLGQPSQPSSNIEIKAILDGKSVAGKILNQVGGNGR